MNFEIADQNHPLKKTDCLILGVFEDGFTPIAQKLNQLSKNYLEKIVKQGDFTGKIGQTFLVYHVPNITPERILLVGCGKKAECADRDFRKIVSSSFKSLMEFKTSKAMTFLTELNVKDRDFIWKISQTVELFADTTYSFETYKSQKKSKPSLQTIVLYSDKKHIQAAQAGLNQGIAINQGVELTKNLANEPSNICTPTFLSKAAKDLARKYPKMTVKVLDEKAMKKLGMGALLAVAKGSAEGPQLICLQYNGGKKTNAPIAFIGKGITFDTGGISLKPADSMVGMKYDMCGAATVLGVMKAAAELKLPLNLVGIIAAAENMPSGIATKPEDIVTTLSGQTVEILNTDAEGRLVLADALTYAERYKPQAIIDIATLTGAVVIALGTHATGLLSNNEELAQELITAGNKSYDRAWPMPLWEEYQDQLKSPFADMSNVGGRMAGTITAACFLSRFAKKYPWAHLDVAGTAAMMMGGSDRYATGRPVPMLMQYLIDKK